MEDFRRAVGMKILKDHALFVSTIPPIENLEEEYKYYAVKVSDWMETFVYHIGEALSDESMALETKIKKWADAFGSRASGSNIPLHHSLHFILHTRNLLYDCIEKESESYSPSATEAVKSLRVITILTELAANTVVSHYTKANTDTKNALQHTNKYLDISIANLNNLKNALYEGTIFTVTDKFDRILRVNDHFCNITKYDRSELIGQSHGELLYSGVHSEEFVQNIKHEIQSGRVWKGELCNKAKDESLYWVDTTIVPFLDQDGVMYQHISIQYDVTEKKRTEEILLKSEKVSLIGELAAGIAHEIRNPLTSIGGLVQLFDEMNPQKNEFFKDIILTEINRINFIVSELMVLAKPHAVYFSWFNLVENTKNVMELLQPEVNLRNVAITFETDADIIEVYGEKNQLTQVMINLLKNAIEAIPSGGEIRLSVKTSETNVLLSIQDNGVGMTEEQVKKLGEPFYTTKSNGTGLGLMICFKIIQNHKGTINVESELGNGTTFTITLPMRPSVAGYPENTSENVASPTPSIH
ncbi:ATP-binding protein [Fictibacillus iocasae]|uniref:histidine kinase n=1 Tax=Fictibacillus iocasae TaxID=2715437 RepID=A0ABW2NMA0_9BACL